MNHAWIWIPLGLCVWVSAGCAADGSVAPDRGPSALPDPNAVAPPATVTVPSEEYAKLKRENFVLREDVEMFRQRERQLTDEINQLRFVHAQYRELQRVLADVVIERDRLRRELEAARTAPPPPAPTTQAAAE